MTNEHPRFIAVTVPRAVLEELLRTLEEQEAQPAAPDYDKLSEGTLVRLTVRPIPGRGHPSRQQALMKQDDGWWKAIGGTGKFSSPADYCLKRELAQLGEEIFTPESVTDPVTEALWGKADETKPCCALCDLAEKISKVLS